MTIIFAAFPACGTLPRSICFSCTGRRWHRALQSRLLIVLTFMPFHVVHPVRVARLRWLTSVADAAIGTALAIVTLIDDFEPGKVVTHALCAIGSMSSQRLARYGW